MDFSQIQNIDPYVRMMRLKKASMMSGKWKDIDHVFTYIASGSADFIVEGNKYILSAGSVIIIPPYMTHIILSHGKEPLVQYIMHFDFYEEPERRALIHKDILEEEYQVPISAKEREICPDVLIADIPEAERNDVVRRYLGLLREFQEKRKGRDLLIKADCLGLLVSSLRNLRNLQESAEGEKKSKTKAWVHIEQAVEFINKSDLTEGPDNDSIARAAGVSPNYLTKVFQEYIGVSLHKYVMNLKVEKARQLLLTGKVNITEAARMTGFSSIHVFSKTFKSIMGISPSEFINQSAQVE
ncbi:MAG: AraC family transcriptional regulator [Lachnospiraceae bacterium]|nr:AraC family transcriptional regulator [Lachnospiraceae bacterium]